MMFKAGAVLSIIPTHNPVKNNIAGEYSNYNNNIGI